MYGYRSGIRRILGEQVVNITPAVQYPHNLGNAISHPIKKLGRMCSNRSELRSYFIPSTPGKGMIFYQPQCVNNFADVVRPLPVGATGVLFQISERSARASGDQIIGRPCSTISSVLLVEELRDIERLYPHPPSGIGCPCRSPRGAGGALHVGRQPPT
jgi:hypothetical protein